MVMQLTQKQISFFQRQLEFAKQQVILIYRDFKRKTQPNLELYNFAKSKLGQDIAPQEDEYGCAEAVNNLIRDFTGRPIGGGLSTYLLYQSLKIDKRFIQTRNPEKGDIIISPSGFGKGHGHTGLISDNRKIMSNNSKDGLWSEHLNLSKWEWKYKMTNNFPIYFYRLLTN